ncbi:MAG: hypothetical protein AVDCRST_MAG73-2837 [uncultured Thermomicrobiales bacterium]|uniref:Uncharacterized protein n=1 Tax=uncultured Thermomicrobiales bacterium TaxID=1645740 RepID=A0A6J4UI60_9BACT|nr:MAG: hypothetical protein AVDCRST_MAG73-2837 [uncultured Thermomicrobiales bacterium]
MAADGNNLLAIRGHDAGVAIYRDVQLTCDDGPAYAVCPLHDATRAHEAGSTVPLKLQLCDVAGTNLSDPAVVVNASGIYQVEPHRRDEPLLGQGGGVPRGGRGEEQDDEARHGGGGPSHNGRFRDSA